jgi:t-SNARE complex subunit (syntaxin)
LARREEDIIHINHQLKEVNAAFKEIDGLVQDQGEVVGKYLIMLLRAVNIIKCLDKKLTYLFS